MSEHIARAPGVDLQDLQRLMMEQEDSIAGIYSDDISMGAANSCDGELAAAMGLLEGMTIQFTAAERELYSHVFNAATASSPAPSVNRAAFDRFLPQAKFGAGDLDKIWDVANLLDESELDKEQFFVALRLAAHLQSGWEPNPELSTEPPPSLPHYSCEQIAELADAVPRAAKSAGSSSASSDAELKQSAEIDTSNDTDQFPAWELEFYRKVWDMADTDDGFMRRVTFDGVVPKDGLDRRMLDSIWVLSDIYGAGHLDMDSFFTAMRLVAHAQAGCEPSRKLASVSPPELPRRSSSQLALLSTAEDVEMVDDMDVKQNPAGNRTSTQGEMETDASTVADMSNFSVPFSDDELALYHRIAKRTAAFGSQAAAGGGVGRDIFDQFLPRGSSLSEGPSDVRRELQLLDDRIVACIWDLADGLGDGCLDMEGFFVALRLASHAMAGFEPSFDLVAVQPSVLPRYSSSQIASDPTLAELCA